MPARENPDWPEVGMFAQRARMRPNRTVDGSPVLDVKPFMREFEPATAVRQPEWASDLTRG